MQVYTGTEFESHSCGRTAKEYEKYKLLVNLPDTQTNWEQQMRNVQMRKKAPAPIYAMYTAIKRNQIEFVKKWGYKILLSHPEECVP